MERLQLTRIARDEAGLAIVEVLVSAVVLLTFAVGVFTVLRLETRATAQERHRAQANDIGQSDLERDPIAALCLPDHEPELHLLDRQPDHAADEARCPRTGRTTRSSRGRSS